MEKEIHSIELIKKYEQEACRLSPDGYTVCFSGGKDSQVMLDLFKRSGVKFKAVYNNTTIDPPENVYFIKKHYPEVLHNLPKENFYQIIEKNKMLPCMNTRFCCKILKEHHGKGFTAVGVRREESAKRAKHIEVAHYNQRYVPYEIGSGKHGEKIMFRPILE